MATCVIFRNGQRAYQPTWRDEPGALENVLAEIKAKRSERKDLNKMVLDAKVERLARTL